MLSENLEACHASPTQDLAIKTFQKHFKAIYHRKYNAGNESKEGNFWDSRATDTIFGTGNFRRSSGGSRRRAHCRRRATLSPAHQRLEHLAAALPMYTPLFRLLPVLARPLNRRHRGHIAAAHPDTTRLPETTLNVHYHAAEIADRDPKRQFDRFLPSTHHHRRILPPLRHPSGSPCHDVKFVDIPGLLAATKMPTASSLQPTPSITLTTTMDVRISARYAQKFCCTYTQIDKFVHSDSTRASLLLPQRRLRTNHNELHPHNQLFNYPTPTVNKAIAPPICDTRMSKSAFAPPPQFNYYPNTRHVVTLSTHPRQPECCREHSPTSWPRFARTKCAPIPCHHRLTHPPIQDDTIALSWPKPTPPYVRMRRTSAVPLVLVVYKPDGYVRILLPIVGWIVLPL
ncbi:hypothetical protein BD410DRAFT_805392 [Rickenella mellea]|uniref:Uncharacterized protein n=1 Tax=Rickenella mellea TaxID=50990 RepID=A0A4Y7PXR6_9AGAM|nr:hypothetical protein BD410DRAFT_805392 [Rickenella mellea]